MTFEPAGGWAAPLHALEGFETDRLTLIRPELSHAEVMFTDWASDPAVTKFVTFTPHPDIEETRRILGIFESTWTMKQDRVYMIRRRRDERLIGAMDITHDGSGASFGYCLAQHAWGRGYMTELLSFGGVRALRASRHPSRVGAVRRRQHRLRTRAGEGWVRARGNDATSLAASQPPPHRAARLPPLRANPRRPIAASRQFSFAIRDAARQGCESSL